MSFSVEIFFLRKATSMFSRFVIVYFHYPGVLFEVIFFIMCERFCMAVYRNTIKADVVLVYRIGLGLFTTKHFR